MLAVVLASAIPVGFFGEYAKWARFRIFVIAFFVIGLVFAFGVYFAGR